MLGRNIKTPYAKNSVSNVDDAKQLIHASDSLKGIDYFCPDCNAIVRKRISHQGTPHFYHLNTDLACSGGGLETALHLLAKQVIQNEGKIWLPAAIASYRYLNPVKEPDGSYKVIDSLNNFTVEANKILADLSIPPLYESTFERFSTPIKLQRFLTSNNLSLNYLSLPISHGICNVSNVRAEHSLGSIKPDIIATYQGRDYLIEVANTHFVDDQKKEKIKRLDIPCVEIDLSEIKSVSYASVKKLLTKQNNKTHWLYFNMSGDFTDQFMAMQRKIDQDNIANWLAWDEAEALKRQRQIQQWKEEEARLHEQEELERKENFRREKKRQAHQDKIKKIKECIEEENAKWHSKGFPRLELARYLKIVAGNEEQYREYLFAMELRSQRIAVFGNNDLISRNLDCKNMWLQLETTNQLLLPIPDLLKSYHNSLVQQKKYEDAKSRLVEAMEKESKKGTSGFIHCPKCRKPCFKFETVEVREFYRRRCIRNACNHVEEFIFNDYL